MIQRESIWHFLMLKKALDREKIEVFGRSGGGNQNEINRDKFIKDAINLLPRGCKILDAGAGKLKWKAACSHLEYVSQDFCQYNGEGDSHGLQTKKWHSGDEEKDGIDIVSDITNIPVKDEEFDAILCSEVLEHIPNPESAIKEFSRIIKPGGTLILTAPFCSLTHFAPYHYCTGFNIYWYEKILEENGFSIQEAERNGDYFLYMRQEVLRLSGVIYTYTRKKDFMLTMLSILMAMRLKAYQKIKNNSDELLCFGYHIKATKIKDEN